MVDTSVPEFDAIWRELEDQAKQRSGLREPLLLRRLVMESDAPEVHLATDGNLLYILIRMPPEWNEDISLLPQWSGMRPGVMHGSERPVPRRFLVLKQEPGAPFDVFKAVASDICEALVRNPTGSALQVATDRLQLWKAFFEEAGTLGLE